MGKIKDIHVAVEDELSFDPLVDAANITVRNMGGDLALTGTVPSYPQYLEAAAWMANGVSDVRDELSVTG